MSTKRKQTTPPPSKKIHLESVGVEQYAELPPTNVGGNLSLSGPSSNRGENSASYVDTLVGNAKNINISSLTVNINNHPAQ